MSITKADRDNLREIEKAAAGDVFDFRDFGVSCTKKGTKLISAALMALPGLLDAMDAAEKRAEKLYGILFDTINKGGLGVCTNNVSDEFLALVPGECAAMKAENKLLRVALAKMRYACECAEKWFAKHGYSPDQLTAEGVLLNELRFALRAEPEARP